MCPCVVTATAFVANPDRIARQHTVLSDASDGSATRAIKLSHSYDTIERERRPSLARATSPGRPHSVSRHILFRQIEPLNTALFTPVEGPQAQKFLFAPDFCLLRALGTGDQRGEIYPEDDS